MHLHFNRIYFIFLVSLFSCQSIVAQKSNSKGKRKYEERLDNHRVHYEIPKDTPVETETNTSIKTMPNNQFMKVDSTIDVLAYEYSLYKNARGYRILIYSGSSEEEALDAKKKLREIEFNAYGDTTNIFQKIPVDLSYQMPNFKVLVGDYVDKLLAFQTLLQLKEEFPKALLIPVKDVKLENID